MRYPFAPSDTVEFSLDGYWRSYDYGARELPPFERFMPQASLAYERDLINRPELRMDIIYEAMLIWLERLIGEHPAEAPVLRDIVTKLKASIDLSKRIHWG